ncbi:MAG TPA: ATP-binding cassette domain-containing protein [Planctomycetota bacterium]|nr:ATP-binding cassette domain-containing protein [Planctomycetota bacterium]
MTAAVLEEKSLPGTELVAVPRGIVHIQTQNLTLSRGGRILFQDMNLTVPRGKLVSVVGASGTGKTSLLLALAGLLQPDSGSVLYYGRDERTHLPHAFKHEIGFVFQELRLVPNTSLLTNVLCGQLGRQKWWKTLFGFSRTHQGAAYELLRQLGLADLIHRNAGETSGGQQQRAAIARALMQQPEVVLADEPVANLDADNAALVLKLFRRFAAEKGITLVCAMHDMALVDKYSDFVLELNERNPSAWSLAQVR